MKDGGDWLKDLTPSQLGQWKVLLARADETISKDAAVAGMRKPLEQALQAWPHVRKHRGDCCVGKAKRPCQPSKVTK